MIGVPIRIRLGYAPIQYSDWIGLNYEFVCIQNKIGENGTTRYWNRGSPFSEIRTGTDLAFPPKKIGGHLFGESGLGGDIIFFRGFFV